ncbi:MAG: dienelactone hydrolase family protein [Gammaproteobacteria bacterium]|jgi:carboxymethylenebutenolidase
MVDKSDIPDAAFKLYDEFAHGLINRRQFLAGLGKLALGGLTVSAVFDALMPDYALAEQVSFNDPDIKASYRTFDSPQGYKTGRGYLVAPASQPKSAPVVLVIHENRGLNPYIKDVARRLAKQGFIAFAPDGLYPLGGYPGNDDEGRTMQASMDPGKLRNDFFAAARFLKHVENGNGKLGVVGFCYGGGVTNRLAAELPEVVDAGVPFYGAAPPLDEVSHIRAPLLLHFGELDERINAQWPAYEAALKKYGKSYQAYVYPGAKHGFHNDSTPRYDKASAELAWQRTLAFFKTHLSG